MKGYEAVSLDPLDADLDFDFDLASSEALLYAVVRLVRSGCEEEVSEEVPGDQDFEVNRS